MVRRIGVLGAVIASLAVLVAGCGSDRLPPADDPVAWAGRVCASLQPLSSMRGHSPKVEPNDPAASRDALSAYFAETEQRASQSLEGLEAAGPSPLPGGEDTVAKLRGALERLRAAYTDARAEVERIDPSDPVALGTRLPEIFNTLKAAAGDPDLAGLGGDPALNDAVKQAPSCSLIPSEPGK